MGNLENLIKGLANEDAVFTPAEDFEIPSKLDALRYLERERNGIVSQTREADNDEGRQDLAARAAEIDLLMTEIEKAGDLRLLRKKLESDIKSLEGALSEIEGIGARSCVGELFKIKSERIAQKRIFERRLRLLKEAVDAQA